MEGETLPRFDSKSRLSGNVKYPREHRMPGYTQKAAFFHLEIVTRCTSLQYHTVLAYASVLLRPVHFRLFPIFKAHFHCQAHLLDTIYCGCTPHIAHIQHASCLASVRPPACAHVCARVAVVPPARSLPADRRACGRVTVPAPVPACSRAVRSACLPAPVCAAVPVCARVWVPAWVCGRVRACAWALSAYLPVACRAFHSPIL